MLIFTRHAEEKLVEVSGKIKTAPRGWQAITLTPNSPLDINNDEVKYNSFPMPLKDL